MKVRREMILQAGKAGRRRGSRLCPVAARLAAVCAATALLLAACGGSAQSTAHPSAGGPSGIMSFLGLRGEPPIGPLPVVTGPNTLQLPLDPYYLGPSEMLTIFEAERAAQQSCIQKYLPGLDLGAYGRAVFLPPTPDPLAYLAPSQAATYGYHDPQVMALAAGNQVPLHGAALTDVDEVYLGTVRTFNGRPVPEGGCTAAGVADVMRGINRSLISTGYGSLGAVGGIAMLIDQAVLLNDSRVKTADTKWSACMASHGYYYSRPQVAAHNPLWNARNANLSYRKPVTVAEIRVAEADVACRATASVYAVSWAVAAAYQREWMASPQNMAMAQAEQKADQVMLTRAEGILGG